MKKIEAVIIDDEQFAVDSLVEKLDKIHEVKVIGTANCYTEAKTCILDYKPDLVFLDIEMPFKNGFELLKSVCNKIEKPFSTIFCTGHNTYSIEALRSQAVDYLLKPISTQDLKSAIQRFIKHRQSQQRQEVSHVLPFSHTDIVSLPTPTGIHFLKKQEIVCCSYVKTNDKTRNYWSLMLFNEEELRLRGGITSKDLLQLLGADFFVQISQSSIINIQFVSVIEIKTKVCLLLPPFCSYKLPISRGYMHEIKERFATL